jgi:hypothetical protein
MNSVRILLKFQTEFDMTMNLYKPTRYSDNKTRLRTVILGLSERSAKICNAIITNIYFSYNT